MAGVDMAAEVTEAAAMVKEVTEAAEKVEAAVAAVRERTAAALDAAVAGAMENVRTGASATAAASAASGAGSARIIRYTPDEDAPGFNPAARTRIIKMVGAAVDPLEPPKHQHKKMPGGPPEAPVPVMHSPTRRVTAEDAAAWKIPPCISNYRNPKGFVIPLDKRGHAPAAQEQAPATVRAA
jgi:SNW domain-containing protein 1